MGRFPEQPPREILPPDAARPQRDHRGSVELAAYGSGGKPGDRSAGAVMLEQFLIDARVRFAAVFARGALQERADEEVQFHLSMIERRMIESGMPPELARVQARRRVWKSDCHEGTNIRSLEIRIPRYGDSGYPLCVPLDGPQARLRRDRGVHARTRGSAPTRPYSALWRLCCCGLCRTKSLRGGFHRLRNVHETGNSKMFDSLRDYRSFSRAESFEQTAVATWASGGRLLRGHGPAQGVLAMPVSDSFFALLGAEAALGRTFGPEATADGCSVVISDRLWRGPLAGDRTIGRKSITLDDRPRAVLGVMPPSFTFYPTAAQAWMLLTPDLLPPPAQIPARHLCPPPSGRYHRAGAAEVSALHAALNRSDGQERDLAPLVAELHGEFTFLAEARLRATLWILLASVALVLLIVCLNVANLLLGQAFGRQREFAVRAGFGSGRGRLARQLLTEGILLAASGGAVGIAVAFAAIRYFPRGGTHRDAARCRCADELAGLAFTAALSSGTALFFGALTAWRASRLDAIESLRGGRGSATGNAAATDETADRSRDGAFTSYCWGAGAC